MYLEHFGLKEFPFSITPDSDFLFMSESHARAKAYMEYTIRNKDGFVVITGEVGTGKTTLIHKLLSEFDDNAVVAKIFQTQLDETEFLQAVLSEFGLDPFGKSKVQLLDMLSGFLIDCFSRQKQLVLIVDEAQNLSPRVLEEIRMLSGLETQKQKILHVILVGQPQLTATLASPALEQLMQRVRLRFHIRALTPQETRAYVMHRLRIAGAVRPLVDENALSMVYDYSGGVPRLINTLCDTALICAYADDLPVVGRESAEAAVAELQWKPYAERPRRLPDEPGGTSSADGTEMLEMLSRIAARLENIEMLLSHSVELLERKGRGVSFKLGRVQLGDVVKRFEKSDLP